MDRILFLTLLIAGAFFTSTQPAYAYLDPGTGSYLIQLVIGGVVGGLFFIKTFWYSIKNWFMSLKKPKDEQPTKPTSDS